ncbi:MAG: MerR family transcriptional regulator [Thiomicrospira sp.]|jgi:DNA-binding transcriptional MerR regulator
MSQVPQQLEIELPDKKYFTIGEVSELCQLKSHVLRYWEQVFPQLNPNKRRGRRYYQRADVVLLIEIKSLLHDQGYTIQGAKARLNQLSQLSKLKENAAPELTGNPLIDQLGQLKVELFRFKGHIQQTY